MARVFYSTLFLMLTPLIVLRLFWKSRSNPEYRKRIAERLGFYGFGKTPEPVDIWIHAVSVGEAEAAFPVVKAFLALDSSIQILMTCTTPTGSSRIQSVLKNQVRHVYLPYDFPIFVNGFFRHYQPRIGIIMETEIWPNLFACAVKFGSSLAIVNGRLSEKSARGYALVKTLVEQSLQQVSLVLAQTEADAARFMAIGAVPDRVKVTGNVKFDIEMTQDEKSRALQFRHDFLGKRAVWIAGSTHPGEEALVLAAHDIIRQSRPDIILLLAPRHPERVSEVAKLCSASGYHFVRRSEQIPCDSRSDIMLVDTLGELRWLYAAADAAFVGGSLVEQGGHNVLEPLSCGVPVLFGPHMFNFSEISRELLAAEGGIMVANAAGLGAEVSGLLADPERSTSLAVRSSRFLDRNRGAVQKVVDEVLGLSSVETCRAGHVPLC